eukprot:TRINITY_DN25142_c0_g1_i1.p1 TRINITY_DN25142_c0_g1~~TRINITY_DN25142_c0_g1_i1.p1  ORF type:complete len:575 (-),score=50.42 TRINITY_DN25142_c0_g1_i1:165-1835(-)
MELIKQRILGLVATQQAAIQALVVENLRVQQRCFEKSIEDVFEDLEPSALTGRTSLSSRRGTRVSDRGEASRTKLASNSTLSIRRSSNASIKDVGDDKEAAGHWPSETNGQMTLFSRPHEGTQTPRLDMLIGFVITCHTFSMVAWLQADAYIIGHSLGLHGDDARAWWKYVEYACFGFEHFFNAMYIMEFIYRLSLHGGSYFANVVNVFDFILVVVGSTDLYVFEPLKGRLGLDLSALRFIRFLKVIRALRIIKAVMLFYELRVLLRTIYSCTRSLATCVALLFVMMLLPGILISQLVQDVTGNSSHDLDLRRSIHHLYGNALASTYTFFQITMSGCWPNFVSPLVDRVSSWYLVFFLPYITFVVFAVIRIITALFLKATMDMAASDADMIVAEHMQKKEILMRQLQVFFQEADSSGDSLLTMDELETAISCKKVKSWLHHLGLEVHDCKLLFYLLDNGDGFITVDEFMRGVGRLKGTSRAIEMEALRRDVEKLISMTIALGMRNDALAKPAVFTSEASQSKSRSHGEGKQERSRHSFFPSESSAGTQKRRPICGI